MTYSDINERKRLIAGLRALADFFEFRPEVPAPRSADLTVFPANTDDAAKCTEIDKIAALIGAAIEDDLSEFGHYRTRLNFGPIRYSAVAITAERRARYLAADSYADSVTPDTTSKEV